MLESFYATSDFLISHVEMPLRRKLMDEVDWNDRLIAIRGGRGIGKTDFLLSYARLFREQNPDRIHEILYVNFNQFYFSMHTLYDFVGEFVKSGGKILLLDQVFKYPRWSKELRDCYFHYTGLHIIFIASPLMSLKEGNQDIGHIVKVYNMRGYSFREYLNIKTKASLPSYTLDEILQDHEQIARKICTQVKPLWYFADYLKQGYYPYREVSRDFSETLLKTMNMMLEVDVLLVKQIDVSYLARIRQLLYLLLRDTPCGLNISELSDQIETSRSTIINYIKFLRDTRLLNLLYQDGKEFPMKPARVYMQNPNLCFAAPDREVSMQVLAETFFYNAVNGKHDVNAAENATFLLDHKKKIDVYDTKPETDVFRYSAVADMEMGDKKLIPLWLFGFLY